MENSYDVHYVGKTSKFFELHKSGPSRSEITERLKLAVRKLLKQDDNNVDVKPLKPPLKGFFRLRMGDVRIMFKYNLADRSITVYEIGHRGGMYR